MELSYAAFVTDPIAGFRQVGARAGFEVDAKFLKDLEARQVYGGADQKWRKYFTESQIRNLDEFEAIS